MKKKINRRVFIQNTAASTAAMIMSPGSGFMLNSCDPETSFAPKINWEEMLKEHNLTWKEVPGDMIEAPHFGNGLLGSMIWIEENNIRLQVFRSDVHDHADNTYGWTAYSRPRYQIGYFKITPKGKITGCNLRQDIYNAELNGTINTNEGDIHLTHFIHRFDDIIYTNFETTGNEGLTESEWIPFPAKGSRGGEPGSERYGQAYAPYKEMKNPGHVIEKHDDIYVGSQDLTAGGNYATTWYENRAAEGKMTLLVTIQNTYPEKESVPKAINSLNKGIQKINSEFRSWKNDHQKWWHHYYPESYVGFPDPRGQSFYWNNIYKMACCTRPDARYIDTPGMWNTGGPWPYSTHDFNTQTAHFPVYTANRLHLGEALVNALKRNKNNLIDNVVPKEWQEDSALLHLATAFDLRGKRDGDIRYKEMFGCLPWLLNNVWLHYRYTMDQEILKDPLFPLLRRSINLYRHILYEVEDGQLHLPPTFTPETGTDQDANFDLALLRWGCSRLIEICGILNIDDPLIPEWNRIITNLTPYAIDDKGYMRGKDRSAPEDHQHMSHLMMIYPLYIENIDNNNDTELLEKSVRNFSPVSMPKMAASQSSPAAAALGLGQLAYERMNEILYRETETEKLGKNGIYYLATPCIETSLSYNTCVQDMLLQSWGTCIRVFPALPDSWKDVEFSNFRAEGGFLISASMKNGVTKYVRIKSLAGEECLVSLPIEGMPRVHGGSGNKIIKKEEGRYQIDLKQGEDIIIIQS